jgi:hypothetical protein
MSVSHIQRNYGFRFVTYEHHESSLAKAPPITRNGAESREYSASKAGGRYQSLSQDDQFCSLFYKRARLAFHAGNTLSSNLSIAHREKALQRHFPPHKS